MFLHSFIEDFLFWIANLEIFLSKNILLQLYCSLCVWGTFRKEFYCNFIVAYQLAVHQMPGQMYHDFIAALLQLYCSFCCSELYNKVTPFLQLYCNSIAALLQLLLFGTCCEGAPLLRLYCDFYCDFIVARSSHIYHVSNCEILQLY
jgi:hypothetical protein